MVTRLKARGMPVHALAEAQAWREANLDPCLVKSIRRPGLCRAVEPSDVDKVAVANELGALALDALRREAWRQFVEHVEAVRAAFNAMTKAEEERVVLDFQIWDALCGFPGPYIGKSVRDERKT
jgi:hypothetical protein